jgi:septal ring factor EnvC (AmiA/AmiB activator)
MVQGFRSSASIEKADNTSGKDNMQNTLEHIYKEITVFEDFKKKLKSELKSIDDLEENLKHIKNEIEATQKAVEKKADLFRKINAERDKNRDINFVLCDEYFKMLFEIDMNAKNKLALASQELRKLIINEDILFNITPEMEDTVKRISNDAKTLDTDLRIAFANIQSLDTEVSALHGDIYAKKARSDQVKRNPVGFDINKT